MRIYELTTSPALLVPMLGACWCFLTARWHWKKGNTGLRVVWIVGGCLLVIICGRYYFRSYEALEALRGGRCQILEGVIEEFRPGYRGRAESFRLGGVRLEYLEDPFAIGYHTYAASGGTLSEGRRVRLFLYRSSIVGIEDVLSEKGDQAVPQR